MVGKRTPMKTGCDGLEHADCMDSWSLIQKKLGFQSFQKRTIDSGERKHGGVDLQSVYELRNSLLKKRVQDTLEAWTLGFP